MHVLPRARTSLKRLKVLHVIGSMDLGGAEKLTRLIVEGLNPENYELSVCCVKSGGYYADQLRSKNYAVEELLGIQKHSPVSLIMLIRAAWRLFRLLVRERPDILHVHLFAVSCLSRVVGKLAGVKTIIVTLHRIEYPQIQPWVEPLFEPFASLYITDSHASAANLLSVLKISHKKMRVIHNGIDHAEFSFSPGREVVRSSLGLRNGDFVLGIVAHLYEEKGHSFLLESLAKIQNKIPGFRLLVVGDGHLRENLRRQAAGMLPEGSVIFLGQRSDLANLLAAMDLLVLPSSWEGFGIILAEAMYMYVPVISTLDGGGCAEVVGEDEGGILVPYGDTAALGEAIIRMFSDEAYRRMQGERGRARVERLFTSEAMCAKYAEAYSGLSETHH